MAREGRAGGRRVRSRRRASILSCGLLANGVCPMLTQPPMHQPNGSAAMPPRDMYAGLAAPRYPVAGLARRPGRPGEAPPHGMPYHAYAPQPGYPPPMTHPEPAYAYDMAPYAPPMVPSAPASLGAPPAPAGDAGAPSAAAPAGPTPTVYLATYSSVPVYEITVRGIALMRRRSDGYLNATQILKIAGIEKARRTRILEREILTGEHDKVQGGFGTFQGTWIPLQRAQELAMNYSVYHLIRPLLDFDPAASRAMGPSAPAKRKPESPRAPAPRAAPQQPRFLTLKPPRASAEALGTTAGGLVHTLPAAGAPAPPVGVPPGSHPTERQALGAYASHGYTPQGVPLPGADDASSVRDLNGLSRSDALRSAVPPTDAGDDAPAGDAAGPRFAEKAVPPRLGDERERRAREQLTGLFVHNPAAAPAARAPVDELQALLHELGGDAARRRSPLNLVIDDHGHTALHWAAALCRLPLVRMLTALPAAHGGANINVGNYAGETALHRSVLVTNAYELSQFPELLELLASSLETRDHRKRTVLHHIALVAGLKGRAAPARYYLRCVLERLGRSSAPGLLDAQDDEGETALSIAARLGNTNMIQMLLEAGARKDLPNYLGITPLDWGITGASPAAGETVLSELGSYRPADMVRSLTKPPPGPVKKSHDVREKLVHTLDELQAIFDREVAAKQSALETTQTHLQAATRELAARRRDMAAAQAAVTEREEQRQRRENLTQALAALPPPTSDALWTQAPLDAAHAALAPGADDAAQAAAVVRLRWLLRRCDDEGRALEADMHARRASAQARQHLYHQVVAMCAQVPLDKVDGMLDELLAAVESIGPDVDMHSVAKFMHKVGRTEAPPRPAAGDALPRTPPKPGPDATQ
ncbi:transcriptional regulator swi6 [Malassezia caprae]|uniref:Transcriptional regulator swi6 n=1 Tax=Malassezia caprae TaxID=1381934 RepID=A0AAF0IWC4_9BASI|nr:transcriptional regulator swi6 [Malassezia caprae]